MEGRAVAKFVRISPRKARRVADLVKKQDVITAVAILEQLPHRAAVPIKKTIRSAVNNIISQAGEIKVKEEDLFLKSIRVDTASSKFLRRLKPRAMGRADIIRHRTSHISVVVAEKKEKEA